MSWTRTRIAGLGAVLAALAIAAPVATASADDGGVAISTVAWGGTPAVFIGAGDLVGQTAAVVGPTVITTAPTAFWNANTQISAGDVGSGGQYVI